MAGKTREVITGQKLTGKELEKMSYLSVADAIRYFSGVQLKDYGGIGGIKTANVRSLGTNHTGVFYDGIQLGNAQNGQIDLGKFSLDNLEAITLYNGQKSDIFQSAKDFGSAGTIYLQTKRPSFTNGKKRNLRASIKMGSFMMFNPSILWEQKIGSDMAFNVNAELISSNGKYPFRYKRVFEDGTVAYDTTATRKNGDITAIRAESTLYRHILDGEWDIHSYFYKSDRGLPGPIVKNRFEHGQRQEDENFFVQSKLQKQFSDIYSLKVNAKYANDYTRYIDAEPSSPVYIDNKYEQHDFYLSTANKFEVLPYLKLNVAMDVQYNFMNANLVNFAYPKRLTLLGVVAGEADFDWIRLQASGLSTVIREKSKIAPNASKRSVFSPSVVLAIKPFNDTDFRIQAFYKDIFRMPTFNDLYYTFVGNATLNPERAKQYNLGLYYKFFSRHSRIKSFDINADVYYNKITDKIVAVPAGNMFRWMMLNLGEVDVKGTEVNANASADILKDLTVSLRLNYTYQKALDVTDEKAKNYKHQIVYIPKHSGSAVIGVECNSWGANYSFIYTGERYNAKFNSKNSMMQPWYTSDVSVYKDLYFKNNGVKAKLSLDVNNILNQHYDVVLNYPMPGRNYRLTMTINI